jgi:hypothetical protein
MIIETRQGILVDLEKVKAIFNWDVKDLCSKSVIWWFLGLYNYIQVFYHHASAVAEPLIHLLKQDVPLKLGPEHEEAFENFQQLIVHTQILGFFIPGYETKVETDTLYNAIGGIILYK